MHAPALIPKEEDWRHIPDKWPGSEYGISLRCHRRLRRYCHGREMLGGIEELEAKEKGGTALNDDQKGKVAARAEVEADIAKWEKMASGEADLAKKVKNLRKKLRQIEELEERLGEGLSLNDEQTGKIESKPKVELELQTLEALVGAS